MVSVETALAIADGLEKDGYIEVAKHMRESARAAERKQVDITGSIGSNDVPKEKG